MRCSWSAILSYLLKAVDCCFCCESKSCKQRFQKHSSIYHTNLIDHHVFDSAGFDYVSIQSTFSVLQFSLFFAVRLVFNRSIYQEIISHNASNQNVRILLVVPLWVSAHDGWIDGLCQAGQRSVASGRLRQRSCRPSLRAKGDVRVSGIERSGRIGQIRKAQHVGIDHGSYFMFAHVCYGIAIQNKWQDHATRRFHHQRRNVPLLFTLYGKVCPGIYSSRCGHSGDCDEKGRSR